MSSTSKNSPRRGHDGGLRTENQESTSRVVVPFRKRLSDKGVGDELGEAADGVGEADEFTAVHRPDPAGGEVLLW
jgi:hypothetical protein